MRRKIVIAFLIIMLPLLGSAAAEPKPESTAELYARAEKLANLFFLEEAVQLYRACIEADYENFQYHLGLIDAYGAMDKVSDLIPYYSQHMLANEKDYIARLGMAFCNYRQGNQEIAQRYAEDAKELRPDSAYVYYCLALVGRTDERKAREVQRYYDEVFRLAPDFARAYTSYIYWQWVLRHAGRGKVLRIVDEALALPQPDPLVYYWKNEVLKADLNYDPREGIRTLKKALEMDDSLVFVSISMGDLYADLGQAEEAEATYRGVMNKAPHYIEGYLHLGAALKSWHRYDEAIAAYAGAEEVPFQEVQKHWSEMRICECLYYARRWEDAARRLEEVIARYPGSYITREAKALYSALISRSPSDKLVLIDGVPYLTQRGNWCGPATLSMLLGYWGVRESQESIAKEIYTGIAGTAPQIIEDYCRARGFTVRTFEGSLEKWRQLINQRVPLLWLNMLGSGGGHYVVVTGYDDIRKQAIVHNPWYANEITVSYKDLDDRWILPSLRRTIAIVPTESAERYDLAGLEPSLRLRLVNFVLYVATGSNLYRGVFPQIFVNLAFISFFLALLGIYLYFCIFPRGIQWVLAYALLNFSLVTLCSSAVYTFRSGFIVSLLLGYHLSVLALLLIAPIAWAFNLFVQDYFTRREFLGLALIALIVFAIPAAVEKEGWQTYLPVMFLVVAAILSFRQRFILFRAAGRMRRGYFAPALRAFERLGSARLNNDPFYAALFLETQARIELCQFEPALALIDYLLHHQPLTWYRRRMLELCRAEARLLLQGADAARAGVGSGELGESGRLIAAYGQCVGAYAALLRGDCSRATELGEAAETAFRKRGLGRLLERFVEFMRCQRSLQSHFGLLNTAALVGAYRCLGASERADEILREHPEIDDFSFRLKGRIVRGE